MHLLAMQIRFDAHAHSRRPDDGSVALVCVPPAALGSFADDGLPVCSGVHPWNAASPDAPDDFERVARAAREGRIAAIGECGLDRFRLDSPFSVQSDMFLRHARLAEETGLPLVIHSVRTDSDILAAHSSIRPKATWILHGFSARAGNIDRLVERGIAASFGPRELARPRATEILQRIPSELLLLETDDSGVPIEDVHRTAARLLEIDVDGLARRIGGNWMRIFAPT